MKKIALIIIFFIFSFCYGDDKNEKVTIFKIGAIGDVVMHIPVKVSASMHNLINPDGKSINNEGFDFLFEPTKNILKSHDIVMANMEFPISYPFNSKAFVFNCPPHILPAMIHSGINIVSFANNHSYDTGRKGVIETIEWLKKAGMKFVGAGINEDEAREGLIFEKNDFRIGILGYTEIFNLNLNTKNKNSPRINDFNNREKVIEDINKMRQKVDFLILFVHWGIEYVTTPRQKEKLMARDYLDNGADMIIGHHPHVLQYIETYKTKDNRETLIVYSLGNFISNQAYNYTYRNPVKDGRQRDSVIMSIELAKKSIISDEKRRFNKNSIFLKKVNFIPVWTVNKRVRVGNKIKIVIKTHPIYDLINEIEAKIKSNPSDKANLEIEKKLLNFRINDIKKVLFKNGIPQNVYFYNPEEAN